VGTIKDPELSNCLVCPKLLSVSTKVFFPN
jgi:hypothetical protein